MSAPVSRILGLLHLDGAEGPSGRDQAVLDALRSLALRGGVEQVSLLHVTEAGRRLPFRPDAAGEQAAHPAILDRIATALDAALPDTRVVAFAARGRIIEEVARINERDGCDLVVLARGRAEGGATRWGEHGPRILRLADAPVLVIPEGTALVLDHAVVGMDLSPNAMAALAAATGLCPRVEALAVVDAAGEGLAAAELGAVQSEMRAQYQRRAADTVGDTPPPPLRILDAANPADALLKTQADLLVIGSRGLTPLAAVLLGSTAERLGGRCESPLLVWRTRGQQKGLFSALFGR